MDDQNQTPSPPNPSPPDPSQTPAQPVPEASQPSWAPASPTYGVASQGEPASPASDSPSGASVASSAQSNLTDPNFPPSPSLTSEPSQSSTPDFSPEPLSPPVIPSDLTSAQPPPPPQPLGTTTELPPSDPVSTSTLPGTNQNWALPANPAGSIGAESQPSQEPDTPWATPTEPPEITTPHWSSQLSDDHIQQSTQDTSPLPEISGNHPLEPAESAPTDLSQLTASSQPVSSVYTPPISTPESLVVPTETSSQASESISVESSRKIPLIAIVGGVIFLLVVAAASAYFILGIGQPQAPQTSVPIEQPPLSTPPSQSRPTPAGGSGSQAPATGSATFGDLDENQTSPTASPASALELLRQRQGT